MPISIENAKKVAAAAVAEAQKNKWNMAIAIVDTGGYLVAVFCLTLSVLSGIAKNVPTGLLLQLGNRIYR
jgi:uncharacterized protein GlcG (DUF336 family)